MTNLKRRERKPFRKPMIQPLCLVTQLQIITALIF